MIEILILATTCLLSSLAAYCLLNRNKKIKICGRSEFTKRGCMRLELPNGYILSVWESVLEPDKIVVCCHEDGDINKVHGDLIYFRKDKIVNIVKDGINVCKD